MIASPLVRAEWPDLPEAPPYDYSVSTDRVHLGVYVRRVSGDGWHVLVGLINHVVVAPESRGDGVGRLAVAGALNWLGGIGVSYAALHCDPATAGFYRRIGFSPAPNFPAPTHNGPRVSMVAEIGLLTWPTGPVLYVEPW